MDCRYSFYDGDIMRFKCRISGSECIYFIPNEKKCEEAIDIRSEYDGDYGKCPCCGESVMDFDEYTRCKKCGQALDWSEDNGA